MLFSSQQNIAKVTQVNYVHLAYLPNAAQVCRHLVFGQPCRHQQQTPHAALPSIPPNTGWAQTSRWTSAFLGKAPKSISRERALANPRGPPPAQQRRRAEGVQLPCSSTTTIRTRQRWQSACRPSHSAGLAPSCTPARPKRRRGP